MRENRNRTTKILKFEQNAAFHFLKYQKMADMGNYIDSLVSLRTALQKDPENVDYQLALAELYTEMSYFEESNYRLFSIIEKRKDRYGDCLFGLGCNFFGLRDVEKAAECFEKYLKEFPGGAYEYEAQDFLEMIEFDEYEEEYGEYEPEDAYNIAEQGKDLLDQGEYEKAIQVLRDAEKKYPNLTFIKNNLALAYYCNGDTPGAIQITERVLEEEPENVHAICNQVLFHLSLGDHRKIEGFKREMENLSPEDIDERIKLALTYCELGENEKAYSILRQVLEEMPYDTRTLFLMGASSANTARYTEALSSFMDMLKLEPENTIALYYKNLVQEAKEKNKPVKIAYAYQVPVEEIKRRMNYLNRCVQKGMEELRELWTKDEYFSAMLLWGLAIGDNTIKRVVVELIGSFRDQKAVEMLKRYLLRKNEPDEIKNDVLLILKKMKVKQPYVAYISGKIAEVRIGIFDERAGSLNPGNQRVVERIIEGVDLLGIKECMPQAVELLSRYIGRHEKVPVMRNVNAWAAGILYLSAKALPNKRRELDEIAGKMGASPDAVKRCVSLIRKVLPESGGE